MAKILRLIAGFLIIGSLGLFVYFYLSGPDVNTDLSHSENPEVLNVILTVLCLFWIIPAGLTLLLASLYIGPSSWKTRTMILSITVVSLGLIELASLRTFQDLTLNLFLFSRLAFDYEHNQLNLKNFIAILFWALPCLSCYLLMITTLIKTILRRHNKPARSDAGPPVKVEI